jgi:hypothetical protein
MRHRFWKKLSLFALALTCLGSAKQSQLTVVSMRENFEIFWRQAKGKPAKEQLALWDQYVEKPYYYARKDFYPVVLSEHTRQEKRRLYITTPRTWRRIPCFRFSYPDFAYTSLRGRSRYRRLHACFLQIPRHTHISPYCYT